MTKLELITLIGDVLTQLDVLRGSLMPNDPQRHDLDEIRSRLDSRQLRLAKNQFDENTESFEQATAILEGINLELEGTLDDVNALVDTLANLRRFVSAVDDIIEVALPLVA